MRYYVYALIDPASSIPFYIGKGINDRIRSHFIEASQKEMVEKDIDDDNTNIGTIAENEMKELEEIKSDSPKIAKLKELFLNGYNFNDIARIVAKDLDESTAFALEAFLIKGVYGMQNLANIIEGSHSERFRPYNNWQCIEGFDIPINKNKRNEIHNRSEKLKMMLAEGIDEPLKEIQAAFQELKFEVPKILDSGELGIEANVKGTRIKIFTRRKNIQIELRGRNKAQHLWLREHFSKLKIDHLLRNDSVFIPEGWKGSKNMVCNVNSAIKRVKLMLEIIYADDIKDLSKEAQVILGI